MTTHSAFNMSRARKLREIVAAFPRGQTGLAEATGTNNTHISAILAGRRGIGDELAAKIERAAGKPPGWLDGTLVLTDEERDLVLALRAARADRGG